MSKDYNYYLRELDKTDIEYCVYGTYGLCFYNTLISQFRPVHDCDIIIKSDHKSILKCIDLFAMMGAHIFIWDTEYELPIAPQILNGKFYIRFKIDNFQFDLLYEHDYEMIYNEKIYQKFKIKVLNESHILKIKADSNRPKDIGFLDFYKTLTNPHEN